jgi:hypothetical protein
MRHTIEHARGGERHQRARTTRVVVSVHGTLAGVTLAIIHCIVVVMVTVVVMVVVFIIVVMMSVTAGSMAVIARRVGVDKKVREDARRRPMGGTECGRQHEHEHRRPHKGDAASARSFQSRQHRSRSLAVPSPPREVTGQRQQGRVS